MADLLPCPFCGGTPEFIPYKRDGLTLKCAFGCPVGNYSQRTKRDLDWLRRAMTVRWNTRTDGCGTPAPTADVFAAYETWPVDIREKLSCHDLRRMGGWAPCTSVGDWRIDTSAGGPILVYKDCSVIEGEQARYVLKLIAASDGRQSAVDACHAAITRALDEACVREPVLRGMALEVGIEKFHDTLTAERDAALARAEADAADARRWRFVRRGEPRGICITVGHLIMPHGETLDAAIDAIAQHQEGPDNA